MRFILGALVLSACGRAESVPERKENPLVQAKYERARAKMNMRHTAFLARPLLEYFEHWSTGMVLHRLETTVSDSLEPVKVSAPTAQPTAHHALKLLEQQQTQFCPDAGVTRSRQMELHDISTDSNGVHHMIFQGVGGEFQYLAVSGQHVLHADPAPCAVLIQKPSKGLHADPPGPFDGGEHSLDLATDPLVADCLELFHKTVQEDCHFDLETKVKAATMQVDDGLAVNMLVKIRFLQSPTRPHWTVHRFTCDFEIPKHSHPDASLLRTRRLNNAKPGPEVPKGLAATIVMSEKLCDCYKKDGVSKEEQEAVNLMEVQGFGELSGYKGFEHMNEMLPRIGSIPTSFAENILQTDFKSRFSKCFPKQGQGVIRDQAQCGSCWAFAAASAAMSQVCISGMGDKALASSTDRYEISVGQIMACNSRQRGCNGGGAPMAHTAFVKAGMARERDSPYPCSAGSAMKHFKKSSSHCNSPPWGSSCSPSKKNNDWHWGGISLLSGEAKMKEMVAAGHNLYASFDVYRNFMTYKSGVFSHLSGSKLGGHAVVMMGFGQSESTKYWLLQNSWNIWWGEGGYAKILRGTNLARIESKAFYVRSWVRGGVVPICLDGKNTGLRTSKGDIPCHEAKTSIFGDLCANQRFGWVRTNCPVSCGACAGGVGSAADWGKDEKAADKEYYYNYYVELAAADKGEKKAADEKKSGKAEADKATAEKKTADDKKTAADKAKAKKADAATPSGSPGTGAMAAAIAAAIAGAIVSVYAWRQCSRGSNDAYVSLET